MTDCSEDIMDKEMDNSLNTDGMKPSDGDTSDLNEISYH